MSGPNETEEDELRARLDRAQSAPRADLAREPNAESTEKRDLEYENASGRDSEATLTENGEEVIVECLRGYITLLGCVMIALCCMG